MVGTLFTLGYSGMRDSADLHAKLGERAQVVVDVRLRPLSRTQAFSTATRRTVQDAGYAYRWLGGLGNAEYRTGGMRLAKPEEITTLVELLNSGANVVIMCVCGDVTTCHRRLVAEMAVERMPGLEVIDL